MIKKILPIIALAAVVGALCVPAVTFAAVPQGIDSLINGGDIYNPSTDATTSYTGAVSTSFTFVTDVLGNYTSLILWIILAGAVIGLVIGLAKKFTHIGGSGR